MSLRGLLHTLVLSIAVYTLLAGCASVTRPAAAETPLPATTPSATPTREPADDFTLETLDGEPVTLSDLQGQWVLVNFWATWCPPCVSEMPYLQRVADERDMVVLGVNFKEEAQAVERFVEENGITFPILMNPDDRLLLFYQARSLPRTHVIDPDGNVALRIIGEVNEERFEEWLDENDVPRR